MITEEMRKLVADGEFEISKTFERHISKQEFSEIVLAGGSTQDLINKITEKKRQQYLSA